MVEFFESRTIFLTIGNVHIYWYGVMYALAFWVAYFLLPILGKVRGIILSRDEWTSIVAWGALGVLVGGRVGYALFYEPLFFLASPLQLFQIWHGGMSSHGGFLGAAFGVWMALRQKNVSVLAVADVITIPAAIGLMLGRIGNSINQEFGMYPFYEAMGNIALAIVCYIVLRRKQRVPDGVVFAVFLILYGIQRFLLEYLRPQEWPLSMGFSRGQLLTIPLLIIAVILLKNAYKRPV